MYACLVIATSTLCVLGRTGGQADGRTGVSVVSGDWRGDSGGWKNQSKTIRKHCQNGSSDHFIREWRTWESPSTVFCNENERTGGADTPAQASLIPKTSRQNPCSVKTVLGTIQKFLQSPHRMCLEAFLKTMPQPEARNISKPSSKNIPKVLHNW